MIIARFGATYSTAYVFPRAGEVDSWRIERPAIYARVGGLPGAFDYLGDLRYPWSALTIRKSFLISNLVGTTSLGVGNGLNLTAGSQLIIDTGASWLTTLSAGDVVFLPGVFYFTIDSIYNDNYAYITQNSTLTGTYSTYYITRKTSANLDTLVSQLKTATIDYGYESKLWFLRRDNTTNYAWAKCTGLKIAEQTGQPYHIRADVEFYSREGVYDH